MEHSDYSTTHTNTNRNNIGSETSRHVGVYDRDTSVRHSGSSVGKWVGLLVLALMIAAILVWLL